MSLNSETAWILKTETSIGLCIMAVGLVASILGFGDLLMQVGILVLIFAPVLGVIVSTKCLIQEKDRKWSSVAIALIVILVVGMVISYFT